MLVLSIILISIMQAYLGYDSNRDFVDDVQRELQPLLRQSQKEIINDDWLEGFTRFSHFNIYIEPSEKALNKHGKEYLGEFDTTQVFILPDGRMQAWIVLPNKQGYVVAEDYADMDISVLNKIYGFTSEDYLENNAYELLILLTLLVMAIVVLVIAKTIEKPIEALQNVQLQFSSGNSDIRANENVPTPVDELSKNFNLMAQKIQIQIKDNQVMTHAISHELRTPLARMQLALGILQMKGASFSEQERSLIGDLDTYIEEMDKLTKTVLTLGKVQFQNIHNLQMVDVDALIEKRIDKIANAEMLCHMDLHSQSMLKILPMHLQLLVDNLVKNAQRYGDKQISVCSYIENEHFVLSVSDDGEGINANQSKEIFTAFARLDTSRSRETGGFGLGLAIVESVVRHYNGDISVETSELGGAQFICRLPINVSE